MLSINRTLFSLLLLSARSLATPNASAAPQQSPTAIQDDPELPHFLLKTDVIHGLDRHKNLFVTALEVDRGYNDVVLTPESDWKAYLNTTTHDVRFYPGDNEHWRFNLGSWDFGVNWAIAHIVSSTSIQEMQGKFYFKGEGSSREALHWEDSSTVTRESSHPFEGWLVCDWSHQQPQLFWIVEMEEGPKYERIDTCSEVDLVKHKL